MFRTDPSEKIASLALKVLDEAECLQNPEWVMFVIKTVAT